jgi:hypothetical protein
MTLVVGQDETPDPAHIGLLGPPSDAQTPHTRADAVEQAGTLGQTFGVLVSCRQPIVDIRFYCGSKCLFACRNTRLRQPARQSGNIAPKGRNNPTRKARAGQEGR